MIEHDELEDVKTVVADAGFDPTDFKVQTHEEQPMGVSTIVEWRTVTRLSNKHQKTYYYGMWVLEFKDDLKSGIFGE